LYHMLKNCTNFFLIRQQFELFDKQIEIRK